MTHQRRRDPKLADVDIFAWHFVKNRLTRKIAYTHRKQWWRQITLKPRTQILRGAGWSPYMHLHRRIMKRAKKAQPLYVIHMQMRQQNINAL